MEVSVASVAIIGSGISGLSAAYSLDKDFDVHVFEQDDRPGGHASTVVVSDPLGDVGVDTGFMVFNPPNYPKLTKFFAELNVPLTEHSGGFNFFDVDAGTYYGTEEFEKDEAYVRANYGPEFISVWEQADRLLREAPRHIMEGKCQIPLEEYLRTYGYTDDFINGYMIQISCSYWSVPVEVTLNSPAVMVIGMFLNHGKDGLGGKGVKWLAVKGGAKGYLDILIGGLKRPPRLNAAVTSVRALADGVEVQTGGSWEKFDYAIVATHADQALKLLDNPSVKQREILGTFEYNRCSTVLHTDSSVMPVPPHRWKSWNYGCMTVDGKRRPYLVYHMNSIQGFKAEQDYFVSLDSPLPIDPAKVIKTFDYEHPVITIESSKMQARLPSINDDGPLYFAGSYFSVRDLGPDFVGFHESGVYSGTQAARLVKRHAAAPIGKTA
ncbi:MULTISPECIES: NAD(P)/FAD-dependent oxidoreductase [Rhizobium/Agrobacterium group]|uniref:FAD-dependent oxidoreductase n=1 Tax=Agrobacterium vitis TaxID=373 RepID=A0ABD6H816_AGRVI|nr:MULTISPECIES: FAD-dependent oxidoreductase [Rhizobium/Agrobacterium group]MCF1445879.1 FAD-dependent oxidoreductase [Allorhizobium ampelinum]MCF1471953.1 FAD-dependent oxidoreductase [Allorhizobium ampelinum]MCF1481210.1 FAD-dependent oxidoreductase [Allorhizobium ampelinum]MCF1491129.1 FAD-dependent oxidoreductase [Allorhizobium ampelinum]MUO26590.1 FAD-dependent oxidoreductase [Agrobacterium vitis]